MTGLLCAFVAGVTLLVGATLGKPTLTALSPEPTTLYGPSTLEGAQAEIQRLRAENAALSAALAAGASV